jgi:hypothetical protein
MLGVTFKRGNLIFVQIHSHFPYFFDTGCGCFSVCHNGAYGTRTFGSSMKLYFIGTPFSEQTS